jgi:hypothetical protein
VRILKILAIVFGALLLLTGAGLLVGSYAASKGDDAMQHSMQNSGLAGPVDGVVQSVTGQTSSGQQVTVVYTDLKGAEHTGQGQAALIKPAKVGDTVSVYYSTDEPDIVVVTDIMGGSLMKVANGLRTGGIVSLVLGGLLLLAGILGLVLGKTTPALTAGGPAGQSFAPQPYPGQQYPAQQYPAQPGQGYPPQPGRYPPQPGQGPAPYPGQYPSQPGQQYPPQPGQPYSPQPGQDPPQGPPSAK